LVERAGERDDRCTTRENERERERTGENGRERIIGVGTRRRTRGSLYVQPRRRSARGRRGSSTALVGRVVGGQLPERMPSSLFFSLAYHPHFGKRRGRPWAPLLANKAPARLISTIVIIVAFVAVVVTAAPAPAARNTSPPRPLFERMLREVTPQALDVCTCAPRDPAE
jgi:hypothetical protein